MIAPHVLGHEIYRDPHVVYFAPDSSTDKVTARGWYVVAQCEALAGPFVTLADAERACRVLGGRP